MAVDKNQIRPILEGQSGRTVADNLKANFDFLADEIDKKPDNGGNSGGGGTTDYPQLTNKPKINGVELNGNKTSTQLKIPTQEEVNGKQPKLISGTNIKTINGNSILGSGNIQISGGSGASVNVVDDLLSTSSTDALSARQGKILKQGIDGKQPKLISGTNIKTINGQSLLGKGEIEISGGADTPIENNLTSDNPFAALGASQGKVLKEHIDKINKDLNGFKFVEGLPVGARDSKTLYIVTE